VPFELPNGLGNHRVKFVVRVIFQLLHKVVHYPRQERDQRLFEDLCRNSELNDLFLHLCQDHVLIQITQV
jgi:hypothetical protein